MKLLTKVNKTLMLLLALIVLGMNLRSPLTAVPPVLQPLLHDLKLNATLTGLLTSIPVLCFGTLTPIISVLISKIGINKSMWLTLIGASIGILLRPYTGEIGILAGTFILGAALATGNIVSLMIIGRDFRHRMGVVTGIYTSSLNIGTMITSSMTAPIAHIMGWQFALASWVWLPVLALLLWQLSQSQNKEVTSTPGYSLTQQKYSHFFSAHQKIVIASLSAGFAAHLFIYYGITAWLPVYLMSVSGASASSAGVIASIFQGLALSGALIIPVLGRYIKYEYLLVAMGGCWIVSISLILLFPSFWIIWCFTGGIAQGGGFVVIFTLIMKLSTNLDDNKRISVIVQGIGYTLASLGPIFMGYIYEYFHKWSQSWLLLVLISFIIVLSGLTSIIALSEKAKSRVN
ncbi:MFS transporter [Shigella flexneri]